MLQKRQQKGLQISGADVWRDRRHLVDFQKTAKSDGKAVISGITEVQNNRTASLTPVEHN